MNTVYCTCLNVTFAYASTLLCRGFALGVESAQFLNYMYSLVFFILHLLFQILLSFFINDNVCIPAPVMWQQLAGTALGWPVP